jgi:hypothetical protein
MTFSPVSESSDPVGSSAKMTFGASASARATATRWASPPDSSPVRRPPLSPMPSRSSQVSAVLCGAVGLAHRVHHLAVEQHVPRVRGEDAGQAMQQG